MTFRKSTDDMMVGTVEGVNASMSRGKPGTAAEIILEVPKALRSAVSSCGYALISHSRAELGIDL